MDTQQAHIFELETNLLQPNPLQARGLISTESLNELVHSVKTHGVLEPIVVAHTPAGYQIIAGERRWRASKIAGLKKVPVVIKETTPRGMLELAIVENVQREDLNPIERAQAYRRLMEEFGMSNQEIADRVSKSASFISNSLRLLTLPDALKDALISGATTEGHMRAIAGLEDPKLMVDAYKEIMKKELSVRRAEDLVRRLRSKLGVVKSPTEESLIVSEKLDQIQKEIAESLKAVVKLTQSIRQTRFVIVLNGKPDDIKPTIERIYQALKS